MSLEAIGIGRKVNDHWLLRDVSCRIERGERVAIVGPSGSGKTVLLRALSRLDPLKEGEVRWNDEPVEGESLPRFRSEVIFLHQRPALIEGTVRENLELPYSLNVHRHQAFSLERVMALLDDLGRDESFLAKQQDGLSGGEQQLTSLIRAIQLDPCMLLLDEPTSALDAAATGQVEQLVSRWLTEFPDLRTAVWVSHDRAQLARVTDRALEMRAGRLETGRER